MAEEKKLFVRFLRDSVADHRDFLAGQEASIPFDDAQLLAADHRNPGLPPSKF